MSGVITTEEQLKGRQIRQKNRKKAQAGKMLKAKKMSKRRRK